MHARVNQIRVHNYAEMAKYCGIEGKDDKEVFENFITKLEELKDFIGVKKTIADYGVDEQYFLDTLDEMTEQAFNDQCIFCFSEFECRI